MSWWGGIEVDFRVEDDEQRARLFNRLSENRESRTGNFPTGSEYGPGVRVNDETESVVVEGRLRDVSDRDDSIAVLAWFYKICNGWGVVYAEMTWELDSGPRYRYVYKSSTGLEKLKGILDA